MIRGNNTRDHDIMDVMKLALITATTKITRHSLYILE